MFERADEIWLNQVEDRLPYHVLGYSWQGFVPVLECLERGTGRLLDAGLEEADILVGRRRTCVGRFEGDGHIACPRGETVSRFVQCPSCAEESFIPHQECIFEPRCEGELCDVEFCRREHVLYMAFYGALAKIGMSSTRRVERRLVEQGADAYAIVGAFPNRKSAREAEKDISSRLRVPQFYRQVQLLENLARPVDRSAIERLHSSLGSSLSGRFDLEIEDIVWLDSYPIDLPLDSPPKLVDTPGRHKGELLGVKGRWLIYESTEPRALNLADVPSRFAALGPASV